MKTEVVIQKVHRNGYDHAVRNTGVKIIDVESKEQLLNAVGPQTAMMYYLGGSTGDWARETPVLLKNASPLRAKWVFRCWSMPQTCCRPWDNPAEAGVIGNRPSSAPAAASICAAPSVPGFWRDERILVRAARLNSSPHSDSLWPSPQGRAREEMVGVYLAAEKYSRLDFAALERQSFEQAEFLSRELKKIPGMEVSYEPHDRTRRVHRVIARWDEAKQEIDGEGMRASNSWRSTAHCRS